MTTEECYFHTNLPDYVLDRKLVINEKHTHQVSGFKLARASDYFRQTLVELRKQEIAKLEDREPDPDSSQKQIKRPRTKSACELELSPFELAYEDLFGLEYLLSFIHNHTNEKSYLLHEEQLTNEQLGSVLKAALHFQVKSMISFIESFVKMRLNENTVWGYWELISNFDDSVLNLKQAINGFLQRNFVKCAKSMKFLEMDLESVKAILQTDELDVSKESVLLEPINAWLNFDSRARSKHYPELISSLRLGRMSAEDLLKVLKNPFVEGSLEQCSKLITLAHVVRERLLVQGTLSKKDLAGDDADLQLYMGRPRVPHSAIFLLGGWEGNQDDPNFGPSKSIQVYNARSNTWKRLLLESSQLDEGHAYSGCIAYDHNIYVIGGYVLNGATQALKVFSLKEGKWKYLSPMHERRNYICVARIDHKIYALGGHNGKMRLDSAECYDVKTNHWTMIASMRQIRSDAGSATLKGKIYVVGGFDGQHFYDSAEVYDPAVNQWTMIPPMHNIRSGVAMASLGDYIYAIGGNDGLQRLRTVERFDPETKQWSSMPAMIRQRSNFCVSVMEGSIYVMGGWSDETNSTISLVEKWSPSENNQWRAVKEISLPASANCCCTLQGLDVLGKFI